jgi:hypothetical protein
VKAVPGRQAARSGAIYQAGIPSQNSKFKRQKSQPPFGF